MAEFYDVIIIGGGAAGSSAASFTASRRLKTLLLDKGVEEGFLGGMGAVSHFPGIADATSGPELISRLRKQAEHSGGQIRTATVDGLDVQTNRHNVKAGNETFEARTVILATGAAARTGYLSGERELLGRGVFHDAHTDGPAAQDKEVAVIGKSKLAAEEALLLSKYAQKIHFLVPSNRLDAEGKLFSQVQHDRRIELLFSTSIKTINGQDHVESITVFSGGQEKEIQVSTVFTYMHDYQPMNQFLKNVIQTAPNGAVMVNEQFETSVPGVFACGDVLCAKPQMPAISVAQGLLAGIGADQYMQPK